MLCSSIRDLSMFIVCDIIGICCRALLSDAVGVMSQCYALCCCISDVLVVLVVVAISILSSSFQLSLPSLPPVQILPFCIALCMPVAIVGSYAILLHCLNGVVVAVVVAVVVNL